MALKLLDFETGPEGAALTGNTQGGNSGASQITTNGGTAVFSKTVVRSGSLGARFSSAVNALCIGRFTTTAGNAVLSANATFTVAATPSVTLGVWSLRGSGVAGRVNWNPDNSLSFVDAGLGNALTIATGLAPGTVYELSLRAKSATSTTGTVTAVLYSVAGVELGRASSSTYNLGTAALSAVDVGVLVTNAAANSFAIDYLQLDDGNTGELRAPQGAPAYTGSASTSSGTAATGAGQATASGVASTSALTSASAASVIATVGAAATSSGTIGTGVGAPHPAATAATSVETAASSTGRPAVPGNGVTGAATTASGSGKAATPGTVATSTGVDASGSGASSEGGAGSATTSSGTTALATGRPTLRGASSTSVRTTATAATLVSLAGAAVTSSGSVASGRGLVASSGEAVTSVEVVTVAAGAIPAERHDVDVAAWLARPRYAAALGATRYDGTIKPNRWRAKL